MKITQKQFLADLERCPGGHCRKPQYLLDPERRAVYAVVWRAWWRGLCTIPLFSMRITPAGRASLRLSGWGFSTMGDDNDQG